MNHYKTVKNDDWNFPIDVSNQNTLELPVRSREELLRDSVQRICRYLPTQHDRFSACLVNKMWFVVAVDVLWERPEFLNAATFQRFLPALKKRPSALRVRHLNLCPRDALWPNKFPPVMTSQRPEHIAMKSTALAKSQVIIHLARHCERLESLTVYGWNLTDKNVENLINLCPDLVDLKLIGGTGLTPNLAQSLHKLLPKLRVLHLDGVHAISNAFVETIGTRCKTLRSLKLSFSQVVAGGIWSLSGCFEILTELVLADFDHLGPDISERFAGTFVNLHTLTVTGQLINLPTLQHLVALSPRLVHLNLCCTLPDGAYRPADRALADRKFPSREPTLRTLRIEGIPLTNAAMNQLAPSLAALNVLAVASCPSLTDDAIRTLCSTAATTLTSAAFLNCPNVTENTLHTLAVTNGSTVVDVSFDACGAFSPSYVQRFTQTCPALERVAVHGVKDLVESFVYEFATEKKEKAELEQAEGTAATEDAETPTWKCTIEGEGVRLLANALPGNVILTLAQVKLIAEKLEVPFAEVEVAIREVLSGSLSQSRQAPVLSQPTSTTQQTRPTQTVPAQVPATSSLETHTTTASIATVVKATAPSATTAPATRSTQVVNAPARPQARAASAPDVTSALPPRLPITPPNSSKSQAVAAGSPLPTAWSLAKDISPSSRTEPLVNRSQPSGTVTDPSKLPQERRSSDSSLAKSVDRLAMNNWTEDSPPGDGVNWHERFRTNNLRQETKSDDAEPQLEDTKTDWPPIPGTNTIVAKLPSHGWDRPPAIIKQPASAAVVSPVDLGPWGAVSNPSWLGGPKSELPSSSSSSWDPDKVQQMNWHPVTVDTSIAKKKKGVLKQFDFAHLATEGWGDAPRAHIAWDDDRRQGVSVDVIDSQKQTTYWKKDDNGEWRTLAVDGNVTSGAASASASASIANQQQNSAGEVNGALTGPKASGRGSKKVTRPQGQTADRRAAQGNRDWTDRGARKGSPRSSGGIANTDMVIIMSDSSGSEEGMRSAGESATEETSEGLVDVEHSANKSMGNGKGKGRARDEEPSPFDTPLDEEAVMSARPLFEPPRHPGDPQWKSATEWRKTRQASSIEYVDVDPETREVEEEAAEEYLWNSLGSRGSVRRMDEGMDWNEEEVDTNFTTTQSEPKYHTFDDWVVSMATKKAADSLEPPFGVDEANQRQRSERTSQRTETVTVNKGKGRGVVNLMDDLDSEALFEAEQEQMHFGEVEEEEVEDDDDDEDDAAWVSTSRPANGASRVNGNGLNNSQQQRRARQTPGRGAAKRRVVNGNGNDNGNDGFRKPIRPDQMAGAWGSFSAAKPAAASQANSSSTPQTTSALSVDRTTTVSEGRAAFETHYPSSDNMSMSLLDTQDEDYNADVDRFPGDEVMHPLQLMRGSTVVAPVVEEVVAVSPAPAPASAPGNMLSETMSGTVGTGGATANGNPRKTLLVVNLETPTGIRTLEIKEHDDPVAMAIRFCEQWNAVTKQESIIDTVQMSYNRVIEKRNLMRAQRRLKRAMIGAEAAAAAAAAAGGSAIYSTVNGMAASVESLI
ncbi:hypothetical protein BC936DRAFT_136543 [Jimgerdemannia flammicorona]|uniref:F-box domain-containing protein n=1 Tax=Jimgerdemannia flammicorona TaxID=994334 RepID=A0A433CZA6_9FUNG|nr:hypothetical protein BC936DRAFT_136543 [Jimgerdemannia flammicorona]